MVLKYGPKMVFSIEKTGPAVEKYDGAKRWYLNDKLYGYNNDFNNISWFKFIKTLIFS